MAVFQIIDYLPSLSKYGQVKEYSSWILATCPICGGKLKISKNPYKYGSYACYSNNCHKIQGNLIRSKLYKPSPFRQDTNFIPPQQQSRKLATLVKELPLTISFSNFKTIDVPFYKPKQIYKDEKCYTYFDYEDFQMVRVDSPDSDKYFYPEINIGGIWVQGLPSTYKYNIPIFRSDRVTESIVIVEGEKTAAIGQLLGLNCITFPMFSWGDEMMKSNLYHLQQGKVNDRKVENILYLQDNDDTGDFKAKLVTYNAWNLGINCTSLNIGKYFGIDRNGYDLYDAYRDRYITKSNCIKVLEEINKI